MPELIKESTHSRYLPAGAGGADDLEIAVTPESAGWSYSSLRVVELKPLGTYSFGTGNDEIIVLPLSGAVDVTVDETLGSGTVRLSLSGRPDVFSAATDSVYVPIGSHVTLHSALGGRFALTGARTDKTYPVAYLPADQVPVMIRGAGQCTRLVRNFGMPDAVEAGAILACEVITPGGNWSSYPAHKHDEATAHEAELEEIYYFEVAAGPNGEPGVAYFRTSSSPQHQIDILEEISDRDVALVPHGWHGPAMAAPGFDLYYLNVMAGPPNLAQGGLERSWQISDHPDHAWVRQTWDNQVPDPRLDGAGLPTMPTTEGNPS